HDQRQEDGGALVFDSDPLQEQMEILGAAEVELTLTSNQPLAMVAVRLSNVAPDQKVTRVTYCPLNLTHRISRQHPEHLVPGERYCVRVRLNEIAQVFPVGHRIRLAISTSYLPLAWPSPRPVRLTILAGLSELVLPVRPPSKLDSELREFGPPEGAEPTPRRYLEPGHHNWIIHRDLATDESTLEVINDNGIVKLEEIDLEVENRALEWYTLRGDDFLSLKGETHLTRGLRRGDWSVRTVAHTVLTSSATSFRIRADLDAFEGDTRVFSRNWDVSIPRDFV
ncbi:MAG: CocE/NonD family hydrolase C-terminal non-catalytic domain-containing protein, partial [Pseudomonadales bacterium]